MRRPLRKLLNAEPKRSFIYLGALVFLKIILQAVLYRRGFISVSADEFSRGITAARWALHPRLNILADLQEVWLPLENT